MRRGVNQPGTLGSACSSERGIAGARRHGQRDRASDATVADHIILCDKCDAGSVQVRSRRSWGRLGPVLAVPPASAASSDDTTR